MDVVEWANDATGGSTLQQAHLGQYFDVAVNPFDIAPHSPSHLAYWELARTQQGLDDVPAERGQARKKKLGLFGGKLSTLFNAYLADFVQTIDEGPGDLSKRVKELEMKVQKLIGERV